MQGLLAHWTPEHLPACCQPIRMSKINFILFGLLLSLHDLRVSIFFNCAANISTWMLHRDNELINARLEAQKEIQGKLHLQVEASLSIKFSFFFGIYGDPTNHKDRCSVLFANHL